jgi:DNA-binding winged helix-turn-helix (wHTH) protein
MPTRGHGSRPSRIVFGSFALDAPQGHLWRGRTVVPMRRKAWEVLYWLAGRCGEIVSNEDLLEAVWGKIAVSPQVLTNTIHEVRVALDDTSDTPRFIQTVRGRGYVFLGDVFPERGPKTGVARPDVIVGREGELHHLDALWEQIRSGRSGIIFVSGEPGIGKTTLVDAFLHGAVDGPAGRTGWVARGVCLEQHGGDEVYLPLFDAIEHLIGAPERSGLKEVLRRCAPAWLVQLPWRLGAEEREALERSLTGTTTPRMLQQGIGFLRAVAEQGPLVLVLEDLHWSDLGTLDVLAALARRPIVLPLLVIATYRSVDAASRAPAVVALVRDLVRGGVADELSLPPLDRVAIEAYVATRFGSADLAVALADRLEEQSAGNPLFLRTLVEELIARGALEHTPSGWRLGTGATAMLDELPQTLRAFIAGELGDMTGPSRDVVEAASVAGIECTAVELAAALEREPLDVERTCEDLARRGRLVCVARESGPSDGGGRWYAFVHAAYRRFTYDQIAPLTRRALHCRMAAALEAGHRDDLDVVAGRVATHYERGGDASKAVEHFNRAAAYAERRFAYREGASYLRAALAHVAALGGAAGCTELVGWMQLRLAGFLSFVMGYGAAEIGEALAAARTVFLTSGSVQGQFMAELGLGRYELVRANCDAAALHTGRLLVLAQSTLRPLRAVACCWAGFVASLRGELEIAGALFDEGLAAADAPGLLRDMDVHRLMGSQSAIVMTVRGDPAGGRVRAEAALDRARANGRPGDLTQALQLETERAAFLRDWDAGRAATAETTRMAHESGLPSFTALAQFYDALFDGDRPSPERIAAMRVAIAERRRLGDRWHESMLLTLVAEVELEHGDVEGAQASIAAAAVHVVRTNERHYQAEMERVQGEIACVVGEHDGAPDARRWFGKAVKTARAQRARLWELRAATSLARLAPDRGTDGSAADGLARVMEAFLPDATCPDLEAARSVLAAHRAA